MVMMPRSSSSGTGLRMAAAPASPKVKLAIRDLRSSVERIRQSIDKDNVSPTVTSAQRDLPTLMCESATSRPLRKLLHAFLMSSTWLRRQPSFSWMMLAVAGSVMSWVQAAKMSRSTSSGDTPARSIACFAALTAKSDDCSSGARKCRVRTPVSRWIRPLVNS